MFVWLCLFAYLPVYLPAPLYVSLLGWICLLPSSGVRKLVFMFMALEMLLWNYNTPDLQWRDKDIQKINLLFLFHNLSAVGQRRVRGTKRWLQSLGIMALVSLRVRNSGSFRCHRMSSTRPGYRFPARGVGPFHGLSPSLTMEKIEKIWNIETMFASNSILALVIPTYSYLGSCFEWWCFGFPTQAVYLCLQCRSTPNSPITYLGFCRGEDWGCPGGHALQRRTSQSQGLALGHSEVFQLQSPMCRVQCVSRPPIAALGEGKILEPLHFCFLCAIWSCEASWVDKFCEIPSKIGWFW